MNSVEQPTQPVADHVVTCPTLPPNLHTEDDDEDCLFFTPPEIQVNSNFPPPPNDTDNITHTSTVADLPPFVPISTPNFTWGDLDGEAFVRTIDSSYDVIVHWRRNLFKVPSGKAGKAFIRELTRLFRAYADGSALENVAMKAAMVMPALLLQKPHARSKAKDHALYLDHRMRQWMDGDIESLMKEACTIQRQLTHKQPRPAQQTARLFAKFMMEGKVRAALRLISEDINGGPLHLDRQINSSTVPETVREILIKKHPPKQPPKQSTIIRPDSSIVEPHPVIFEKIDGPLIRSTALRMDGAAGPSGLDAAVWKRMCTSFKQSIW